MDGPEDMAGRYGEELFDVLNGNAIEETSKYRSSDRILDLGSNDTFSVPYMTDAEVVQVDTDPASLHDGAQRAEAMAEKGYEADPERIAADADDLPFAEDSFDTVVACASFYNGQTGGPVLAYSDVPNVLEEGGRLVLGSGTFEHEDDREKVQMSALGPLTDHFDEIYSPGARVLVLKGYQDPDVNSGQETLTSDELEDRLHDWDGSVQAQDPLGATQEYDRGPDLERWIRSDLHIIEQQYPSIDTGEPALVEAGETQWYEATIDGQDHAFARVSIEGPEGRIGEYRFRLGPADEESRQDNL